MTRREIRSWLMDMDGVLVHEEHAIPGVLTGITTRAEAERYSYRASRIVDSIADLVDELG